MLIKYYGDIKKLRKEIRQADYCGRLYPICCNSYKEEIKKSKKFETQLRNFQALDTDMKPNMAFIFNEWINTTSAKTPKKKQELIITKLSQIATQHSNKFFESRVLMLKNKNRLTKRFYSQEKKAEEKIDNLVKDLNNPKLKNLSSSIIATENLAIDNGEIEHILHSANSIKQSTQTAHNKLFNLTHITLSDLNSDAPEGDILFEVFDLIVHINPELCALKNKLIVHTNNRDIIIILDELKDFFDKFINLLVMDWFQNNKIKNSIHHLRDHLKSVDLLIIYLEKRLNKISTELEIRRQTVELLLSKV